MTVRELLGVLDGTERHGAALDAAPSGAGDPLCMGVTHDSREAGPGVVFVGIRGLTADGAAYAPQALAAGAAAVVAQTPPDRPVPVPWVVVPDARAALAALAVAYYRHPSRAMRVVGVTGTNGKTTTTYLLREIFEAAGVRCGLVGTVGYHIGDRELPASRTTPESPDVQRLLRTMVEAGCGACAMEVSSHALALHRVDGMAFAAGVFTNLSRDHLDFHASMEEYFAAKRRLFEMLPAGAPAVLNLDDPKGGQLAGIVGRPVTYAMGRTADVTPGPVIYALSGLRFDARTPRGSVAVQSRLVGRPNVSNILAAVAAAGALDLPLEAIECGLRTLQGVPGRFELVSTPEDDVAVIVDYAHTDDALRHLLETAREMSSARVVTVFGAGGDRDRTKRPLMGMVAARLSDVVIVTSDNPRTEDPARIIEEVRLGADAETRHGGAEVVTVIDRREAIDAAVRRSRSGDVVLIAGRGHEKYQETGGVRVALDDVAVAREALEARRVRPHAG
jgi:UDP-N-acetylmuramoyl-L-alanyl-D-glutamate--2,6-diaminopimelate ligase